MINQENDFYSEVSSKMAEAIEQNQFPYKRDNEWIKMPFNVVSGHRYGGANAIYLLLLSREFSGDKQLDPRWCSFQAASKNGWKVKKGSKGVHIKQAFLVTKDKDGQPLPPEQHHFMPIHTVLFHASQLCVKEQALDCEGDPIQDEHGKNVYVEKDIPAYQPLQEKSIEKVKTFIEQSGAEIYNDQKERAFYQASKDAIHLPLQEAFANEEAYYATLLYLLLHRAAHEIIESRPKFGTMPNIREELRVEIAAMFLSAELGVKVGWDNQVYHKKWIQLLQKDKFEFFRAANDAQKILNHLLLPRDLQKAKLNQRQRMKTGVAR